MHVQPTPLLPCFVTLLIVGSGDALPANPPAPSYETQTDPEQLPRAHRAAAPVSVLLPAVPAATASTAGSAAAQLHPRLRELLAASSMPVPTFQPPPQATQPTAAPLPTAAPAPFAGAAAVHPLANGCTTQTTPEALPAAGFPNLHSNNLLWTLLNFGTLPASRGTASTPGSAHATPAAAVRPPAAPDSAGRITSTFKQPNPHKRQRRDSSDTTRSPADAQPVPADGTRTAGGLGAAGEASTPVRSASSGIPADTDVTSGLPPSTGRERAGAACTGISDSLDCGRSDDGGSPAAHSGGPPASDDAAGRPSTSNMMADGDCRNAAVVIPDSLADFSARLASSGLPSFVRSPSPAMPHRGAASQPTAPTACQPSGAVLHQEAVAMPPRAPAAPDSPLAGAGAACSSSRSGAAATAPYSNRNPSNSPMSSGNALLPPVGAQPGSSPIDIDPSPPTLPSLHSAANAVPGCSTASGGAADASRHACGDLLEQRLDRLFPAGGLPASNDSERDLEVADTPEALQRRTPILTHADLAAPPPAAASPASNAAAAGPSCDATAQRHGSPSLTHVAAAAPAAAATTAAVNHCDDLDGAAVTPAPAAAPSAAPTSAPPTDVADELADLEFWDWDPPAAASSGAAGAAPAHFGSWQAEGAPPQDAMEAAPPAIPLAAAEPFLYSEQALSPEVADASFFGDGDVHYHFSFQSEAFEFADWCNAHGPAAVRQLFSRIAGALRGCCCPVVMMFIIGQAGHTPLNR